MSMATSITVRVPLAIRRRPGRKTVVVPEGTVAAAPTRTLADPALVKALARAFRWKRMLEDGRYASISEMAAEQIERGYLGKLLQLTLLAPAVVEAVLEGKQDAMITLPSLFAEFSSGWGCQRPRLWGQRQGSERLSGGMGLSVHGGEWHDDPFRGGRRSTYDSDPRFRRARARVDRGPDWKSLGHAMTDEV